MRGALDHLRRSDPVLAAVIDRVGPFAISYREPTFETLWYLWRSQDVKL